MNDVVIYTTRVCPYCVAAKKLLGQRGVAYDEVDVSTDDSKRKWLVEATGRRTVPQIFIRGEPVGGFEELAALDKAGTLAEKLKK